MNVRLRRLQADYEMVKRAFAGHARIHIQGVLGSPPEKYHVEYRLRSLEPRADGQIMEKNQHLVEVLLTRGYPRQAPQCRMLTPIFHPNIAPHAICVGDHWAAGESLANLIVRIGEIIAFQSYNTKSPLNGEAARWADQNKHLLPLDPVDLSVSAGLPLPRVPAADASVCQNCGSPDSGQSLSRCKQHHLVCPDCRVSCPQCGGDYCVLCALQVCAACGKPVCATCLSDCPSCRRAFCAADLLKCDVCGATGCTDCVLRCVVCNRQVCLVHVKQCPRCQRVLCEDHATACGCTA
jgi:ubiquitin-protein ligase